MKALVSRCKAVCAPPAGWVASVHLRKLKRGVGEFVCRCYKKRFCPLKFHEQRRKHWEAGRSPSLPVARSVSDYARFCLTGLRQNAQGKGSAEGLKKEQPAKDLSSIKIQKGMNI